MAKDSFGKRMPWFRLWAKDFMADPVVQGLSWERRGRYLWALMCSWETDGPGMAVTDDWRGWMGYSREDWEMEESEVGSLFKTHPEYGRDVWVQDRLHREYLASKEVADKRAAASDKANKARWSSERTPTGYPNGLRTDSPSVSESVSEESKTTHSSPNGSGRRSVRTKRSKSYHPIDREWMETFDEVWWPEYLSIKGPGTSKAMAREVWAKIPHADGQADFDRLTLAFDVSKSEWKKASDLKYIPHPDKWLRHYLKDLMLEAQ